MPDSEEIKVLKSQLQEVLASDSMNYDRVVELSSNLARYDPNHVRFSVDAAHVARLGRELVARQETAVSELVKNAYDADASQVELTFHDADYPGGSLLIIDDGAGMTRDELINGFMRLSSQDKVRQPSSPLYNRQRAGRKGIGRFATQRLGSRLTVTTSTKSSDRALRITIDWERFQGGTELGTISSRIEEVEGTSAHGTTLFIEKLSDSWTEASINRIFRYLADLIQPFPLSKLTEKINLDPGFQLRLYRKVGARKEPIANVESMVYDYALAEIAASVDKEGSGYWSITSKFLGFEDKAIAVGPTSNDPKHVFQHLRDVHLKAYYYIYNAKHIPRNQSAFIRDLANSRGGIRLYRNGFRVLPYGDPLNDWLELDASYSRRTILPPHSNINWFGFVEVTDLEGTTFEETSSREGLIRNAAYEELVSFVYRVLRGAALRVGAVRERKTTPGQKDWQRTKPNPTETIRQVAQGLADAATILQEEGEDVPREESGISDIKQRANVDTADILVSFAEGLNEAAQEQEEQQAALLEEIGLLRVLASLGLSIGEFSHEVKTVLPVLTAEASYFRQLHTRDIEPSHRAEQLVRHITTLRNFTAYFGRAIEDNAQRETRPQELGVVLRSFHETLSSAARRYGIVIEEPDVRGFDLFTCPMHPSEWVSILMNFFTNSKKAIDRARSRGKICLRAGREDNNVYVEFADNGDGIPQENEDRIFDAFFTTTSPAGNLVDEAEEARGTGLGLKIVRDIVSAYSGTIGVVGPPVDYRTCLRVEIRAATEEEMEQHGV